MTLHMSIIVFKKGIIFLGSIILEIILMNLEILPSKNLSAKLIAPLTEVKFCIDIAIVLTSSIFFNAFCTS